MVARRSVRVASSFFIGVIAAAFAVIAAPARAASGMRCGNRLVTLGDHKSLVLDRCGEPDFVDQQTIFRSERVTYDGRHFVEIQIPIVVEVWVYDLGPNRFIEYLQFQNGRMSDVVSGPYGRQ